MDKVLQTSQPSLETGDRVDLRIWRWLLIMALVCLLPAALLALGIDFSTHVESFGTDATATFEPSKLAETAHAVLRGNYTHTILEWTAVCTAAFVTLLAFVQFRMTKEPSLPVIGIALACAGAMDAFHTLAANRLIEAVADNRDLIPFTWAICRLFNGTILAVGVGIFVLAPTLKTKVGPKFVAAVSFSFIAIAYAIINYCATTGSLPQTMFADQAIKRPFDLYPLLPYALCGLIIFPIYFKQNRSIFAATLIISLVPHVATQLYMAFGSFKLHDSSFNVAHGLKAVAYMVPVAGLLLEFIRSYHLRVQATTLATMNADVGIAAASLSKNSSHTALQDVADIILNHLDASLVRIWTLGESDSSMEPRATASRDHDDSWIGTHEPFASPSSFETIIYGTHFHSNNAASNNSLSHAWINSHNIVSCVAEPLLIEGRSHGLLLICSKQPLDEFTLKTLAMIADGLAVAIDRKRANASAMRSAIEAQLINHGATIAATAKSFDQALSQILDMVCEVTGWPVGHVYLCNDKPDKILIPAKIWHIPPGDEFDEFKTITERTKFQIGEGLPGRIALSGKPAWINNIQNDTNFPRANAFSNIKLRAAFGIPVKSDGKIIAVLEFFTTQELPPDEYLLDLMKTMGDRVAQVFEQQNIEHALRDAEAHTRGILDSAVDCIISIDEQGLIESFNKAAELLFYYKAGEVLGKNVNILMPSPYHSEHDEYLQAYRDTGVRQIIGNGREVVGRRKDGSKFPIELSVSETLLSDRKLFTGIIRDITERKQTEQDLHESAIALEARTLDLEFAQAQLQGAANFGSALNQTDVTSTYRSALACMADSVLSPLAALFVKQANGKLKSACVWGIDQGLMNIKNLTEDGLPRDVLGSGMINILKGPFTESNMKLHLGIGTLELNRIIGWPIVFQSDCIGVLVTVHVNPISEQDQAVIIAALDQLAIRMNAFLIEEQRFALMEDLKKKSDDLEEAKLSAERSSRVKSEFLANMSHELRTPMNSIIGFTHRLIKRLSGSITERDIDALQTVDRNAKHLLGLINDILDLSKIEAGKIELAKSIFDMVDLVDEVLIDSYALVDNKPIELIFTKPRAPIQIEADRTKVRQVMINILSNSIKYTDQGTVTINVEEKHDSELGLCASVSMIDTGVGIKPEDKKRLFKKFTQLDASVTRRAGGTGLGLVITAQYVQMHGGKITVESEFGRGSNFTVLIPLSSSATPTTTSQSDSGHTNNRSTGSFGKNINILCVDSDPKSLKDLKATFDKAGYHVDLANDIDTAITIAQRHKPDLICLDTPTSSDQSFALLKKIRENKYLAVTPIIAINFAADNPKELIDQGTTLVSKPATPEKLLLTARKILSNSVGSALIVDDDPDACQLLASELRTNGADVQIATNGLEALQILESFSPQIILLDLMMPIMNGIEFLEKVSLVPSWSQIPVVVVTSKTLDKNELALLVKLGASIVTKGQETTERTIDAIFCTLKNLNVETEALSL